MFNAAAGNDDGTFYLPYTLFWMTFWRVEMNSCWQISLGYIKAYNNIILLYMIFLASGNISIQSLEQPKPDHK